MQKVHLGKTQSGELGFFTGRYLCLPFGGVIAHPFTLKEAKEKAASLGFEFEPTEHDEDLVTECRVTRAWEQQNRRLRAARKHRDDTFGRPTLLVNW